MLGVGGLADLESRDFFWCGVWLRFTRIKDTKYSVLWEHTISKIERMRDWL